MIVFVRFRYNTALKAVMFDIIYIIYVYESFIVPGATSILTIVPHFCSTGFRWVNEEIKIFFVNVVFSL